MLSSDAGGRKDGEAFPSLSGGAQANRHPLLRDHVLASAAVSTITVGAQLQQSNNHEKHQETIQVYVL